MQISKQPIKILEPFAVNGDRNTIPVPSQASAAPGAASFNDGFPLTNSLPPAAGGVPPSREDMNGVLYALSAVQQWQCAGGLFQFDADFASANGGYPKGAILLSADGASLWQNMNDGNSTNPDATDGTALNWVSLGGSGFTSLALSNANVKLSPAQWGKGTLFFSGALTANVQIILPTITGLRWTVMNSTTGAYTLTIKTASGSGAIIPQGQVQGVVCDGTNMRPIGWVNGDPIDNTPIGQQTPAAVTGTVVKATQGFIATGNVPSSPPSSVILDFNSGNGRLYAQTSSGAYANILMPGGGFQVPGGIDNTPIGQTTQAAGAFTQIGVTGGVWSAPAAGHGLGMGNPGWGLVLAGNGSSYDVVIANKNEVAAMVIPTGTYRVVFNSAADDGSSSGVFGGPVAVGAATAAQHAVRYDQFSSSLAANGWRKLPNGDIEQWGTTGTLAPGGTAITFPIAFPNNCFNVVSTRKDVSGASQGSDYTTNWLKTGFTQYNDSPGASAPFAWRAIGN